ncbi:hypothetical protein RN001_010236 [Aquatica leii]|uniref:Luciferin 4-monooxygenase n=1 Tax=Aquatica leii TaxID=1421715 RepID=A0AAN7Q333_9COLE|nr:hypothetical protein RN001_010236 [Aquatica leii]
MSVDQAQDITKDSNNVIYGPCKEIPTVDGIGTTLFNYMKKYGSSIAQIDGITGQKRTHNELLERCIKTCIYMQSKGIKPNDVVTICSLNHLDTFVPFVGGLFAGAIIACTDPRLSLLDTVYLIEQIRPNILFVSEDAVDLIEKTLEQVGIESEIVVFGNSKKHTEFTQINSINYDESFSPHIVKNIKETAVITFSSGSTGSPKGVCLNHFGLLAPSLLNRTETSTLVVISTSTLYWISAVINFIRNVIFNFTQVIIPDFDEIEIWNWIKTYKVSLVFLASSQLITLAKKGRPADADTSSVRLVLTGGTKISEEQILKIRSLFPNGIVLYAYGLAETSGLGVSLDFMDNKTDLKIYHEKPNCIGRPQPCCVYKVIDTETGENLGPNEIGELCIKTVFHMNGYYNNDSTDSWDSEGFIKTGDLVYYDEEFGFYYVDRIKEMLKYRSWQISPAQLEAIILNHPAVKNVVVVGKLDPEDGDHPLAVVEITKPLSEEEIMNFVAEQVSDMHRLRGGVKFVDKIPVSVTGKNRRMFIKDLVNKNQL